MALLDGGHDAGPSLSGALSTSDGGLSATAPVNSEATDAGEPAATDDLTLPDASVPDTAAIVFTAEVALEDYRIRLLTDDDRFVPNHAELSGSTGATRAVLTPAPFWPPRGCCRLVVDGEVDRLPSGGGSRFLPFEAHFGVTADPLRLAAAIAAHKRGQTHRRRHR